MVKDVLKSDLTEYGKQEHAYSDSTAVGGDH